MHNNLLIKNPNEFEKISNLANIASYLYYKLENINWVGFYILKDQTLHLGPFMGKVACTHIEVGKGVCGTCVKKLKTIVVDDVSLFKGHITCDSNSKSEIVIPIFKDKTLYGVLDIDSPIKNRFSKEDRIYLENLCLDIEKV